MFREPSHQFLTPLSLVHLLRAFRACAVGDGESAWNEASIRRARTLAGSRFLRSPRRLLRRGLRYVPFVVVSHFLLRLYIAFPRLILRPLQRPPKLIFCRCLRRVPQRTTAAIPFSNELLGAARQYGHPSLVFRFGPSAANRRSFCALKKSSWGMTSP